MFRELSSEAVDWALGECGGIVAVWGPVAGLDASGEDRNFLQLWESNHDSPVTTPPPASSSAFVFLDNTKCPSVYRTVS